MLSNTISAVDQRRRTHRRQISTPTTEMPYIPNAHPGLQRAQMQQLRGHRRGLSLDQRMSYSPAPRLVPTLGPISSDDMLVSTHTNNDTNTQHSQHPLQFAQHAELVQPGHHFNRQSQHMHLDTAAAQTQYQMQSQAAFSPVFDDAPIFYSAPGQGHSAFTPSPQLLQQPVFSNQMGMSHGGGGSRNQLDAAKRQLEACFPGMNINIQVLPTPVATPQKRASISSPDKIGSSPMTFDLNENDIQLQPTMALQPVLELPVYDNGLGQTVAGASYDGHIHSPHALSPTRSFIGSPLHQALSPSHSSTLLEIEGHPSSYPSSPMDAHPIAFADLSVQELKGAVVATGVAAGDVDRYISAQDPSNRKYYCLYEGCTKNEGFGRRENIRAHVQTHLNDRAYRCLVCNSAFVRMNDLKRHSKIHKDKKEFQCECGSMFARHDALTRHKQRGCCSVHSSPLKANKKKPGRPKKHRPELDDRMAKSAKQRQMNSSRDAEAGSDASDDEGGQSPSPELEHTEFASFDAVPLPSSSTLVEEAVEGSALRSSPPPEDTQESAGMAAFDDYTLESADISVNSTFSMPILEGVESYTPAAEDSEVFSTSMINYLSNAPTPVSIAAVSPARPTVPAPTTHTIINKSSTSSLGGLGYTSSTPPPDHPHLNTKLLHQQSTISKASPSHSLCELSTPPSSPPELHLSHPVFGLDDEGGVPRFWDFMSPMNGGGLDGKPLTQVAAGVRCDWDDVDADLFGDELPVAPMGGNEFWEMY